MQHVSTPFEWSSDASITIELHSICSTSHSEKHKPYPMANGHKRRAEMSEWSHNIIVMFIEIWGSICLLKVIYSKAREAFEDHCRIVGQATICTENLYLFICDYSPIRYQRRDDTHQQVTGSTIATGWMVGRLHTSSASC